MIKIQKQFVITASILTLALFASTGHAQYECVKGDCVNGTGRLAVKGSTAFLEGKFVNRIHVNGKVVFPNGNVFEGIFKDHKLAQGIKTFKNGKIMQGKFIGNVLIDGTITEPNGKSRRIKLKPMGIGGKN